MIEVSDLTIKVKDKILVDNISFNISEKESLGIIGQSGSGKTLTVLSIMGLLDRKIYDISGSIKFLKEELLNLSEKEMAKKRLSELSIVYQNPFNTFSPVEKIDKQISRIFRIKKIERDEKRLSELLDRVSLSRNYLNKFPHELSGGELQRFVIAISLLLKPSLLICDEPTTSLDKQASQKVLNLLNELKKEENFSLIFVTHDLSIVDEICDRIIIMKSGRIIERGNTLDIFNSPKEEYTKNLLKFSKLGD